MPGENIKRETFEDKVIVTYTVDNSQDGARVDLFLKNYYKRKSRNELQKEIDSGKITIEGKRLKPSTILHPGDQIKVHTIKRETIEPEVNANYKILFEDDDLIVVDKPGNLPVHPAGRFVFNNLLSILRKDRKDWLSTGNSDSKNDRDFYLIHRLDRETSGIIILAKKKRIASLLIDQFFNRETEKKYFAIATGIVKENEFIVSADLGQCFGDIVRLKMKAYDKGHGKKVDDPTDPNSLQSAHTEFKVLQRYKNKTLLECTLKTGRQHQIRVHLQHVGHPIVGDKLYGPNSAHFLNYIDNGIFSDHMKQDLEIERHALHSKYLKFFHPTENQWIEINSELPEDLKEILK